MTSPLISVILPVFNGGDYLRDSVQSVLDQDLDDFEFLILDDCSTDGSLAYLESLADPRIRLYKNETNKGLFYNLNFLVEKCQSSLIKLWSQDDIMYENCLAEFVAFHNKYPQLGFSYCARQRIDDKGKSIEDGGVDKTPSIISPELHARIAFFTGSIAGNIANTCISVKALETVGLFKEYMKISADFDMWVRLAKDHDTGFIKKKLIKLRDHSGQLSRKESLFINNMKEDLEIYQYLNSYVAPEIKQEGKILLRKYKLPFYYSLMSKAFIKGDFKTAFTFARALSGFDNFILISIAFLKSKINRPGKPEFLTQ